MKYSIQELGDYYGYIYIILDQKHNKVYIGQKKGKIENSQDYFGSGLIIKKIIKSRGTYFLKKTVLGVCYSKEELEYWETECKYFFNAFDKNYGYNIAIIDDGGDNITFHPEKERIQLQMSLTQRLKIGNLTEEDRKILINILNDYKNGLDPFLLNYKEYLIKKEQEYINSLLTFEERSLLHKSIWENKSEDEKQRFKIKMIEIMNKEDVIFKSKESRKNPEYKKLISKKITDHCSKAEIREERRQNAKNQWGKEGAKDNYSKNRIEWHSKPENKKKHSDAIRKESSFLVEDHLKNMLKGDNFTYYELMGKYNSTYYIVDYWVKKEIKLGNLIKGKSSGSIPIRYTRIK